MCVFEPTTIYIYIYIFEYNIYIYVMFCLHLKKLGGIDFVIGLPFFGTDNQKVFLVFVAGKFPRWRDNTAVVAIVFLHCWSQPEKKTHLGIEKHQDHLWGPDKNAST